MGCLAGPNGYEWLNAQDTFSGTAMESAIDIWRKFAEKGYINKDALSIGIVETAGKFAQTGAAMMYNGNWFLKDLHVIMGENLGMFQLPPADPDGPFADYQFAGSGSNTAVTAYTKHPDEAFKLLKVLISDDFQAAMMNQKGIMPNNLGFNIDLVQEPIGKELLKVATSRKGANTTDFFPVKLTTELNRLSSLIGTARISTKEAIEILNAVLEEIRAE